MIDITNYIQEKLKITSKTKINQYTCHPKTSKDLRKILKERLSKDKNADLNDIDVSKITDMVNLFYNLDPHNIDISEWDVSSVKSMDAMFYKCKNFKGEGLENWNVSNVKNMYYMFFGCTNLNCNLENWDVSNVKNMYEMFYSCNNLKNKPNWYKE